MPFFHRREPEPAPQGPQQGSRWEGRVTYTTDPHIHPIPGYYAQTEDGIDTGIRLAWVDATPDDVKEHATVGWFEVAGETNPVQRAASDEERIAALQASAVGTSEVQ
jgi:hypothetical protein